MTAIPIAVIICFLIAIQTATRRALTTVIALVMVAGVMAVQCLAASSGLLRDWDRRPPPLMILLIATLAITIAFAFSKLGGELAGKLSLAALVFSQAFRLPLELTMHMAAGEGVMPVQMSYSGRNFDILTGTSALILGLALLWTRVPTVVVRVWNLAGFLLLANIVGVAIASMPIFHAFGPDRLNTWIADPPFVWLPGILVPMALMGHILIWRKLRVML
jgi:hypothetical protein